MVDHLPLAEGLVNMSSLDCSLLNVLLDNKWRAEAFEYSS